MVILKPNCPVVIGGLVMDLRGQPYQHLGLYTSNPGYLSQSPGGVAQNIAANLHKLSTDPFLISAVGKDLTGTTLLSHLKNTGLNVEGILQFTGERSAVYLAVLESGGDLHTAIADMEIFRLLTPELVMQYRLEILSAPIVIVDTNLPTETLQILAELCYMAKIPFWAEPVSVEKSLKLKGFLKMITYLSPNRDELAALSEMSVDSDTDMEKAVQKILSEGTKCLVVTLGAEGVLVGTTAGLHRFAAFPAKVRDVTGAGDAFVAGMTYGLLQKLPTEKAVKYGLAVASVTIEAVETVSNRLNTQLLKNLVEVE